MSNFVGYKPSPLSILVQGAKNIFKSKGKNPTPGTINTVPIAKNLTTKRNIQDKVVAAVDKGVKAANVPPSLRGTQSASKMKKEKSKELKDYSYTADKYENKAKGGRVGLKFGSKKKSNIQKIKETFGPGSSNPKKSAAKKKKSFPDLNKDGKVTFADILKGRGVKRG